MLSATLCYATVHGGAGLAGEGGTRVAFLTLSGSVARPFFVTIGSVSMDARTRASVCRSRRVSRQSPLIRSDPIRSGRPQSFKGSRSENANVALDRRRQTVHLLLFFSPLCNCHYYGTNHLVHIHRLDDEFAAALHCFSKTQPKPRRCRKTAST